MAKVELKQPIVEEIINNVKDAESVVLVNYSGLTVEQDTALRKELPMGIDYEKFHRISSSSAVKPLIARTRAHFGDRKLVLSVDRLDYSKGIRHRLHGFDSFLKHHPEYLGKVTLAIVIVPSRDREIGRAHV